MKARNVATQGLTYVEKKYTFLCKTRSEQNQCIPLFVFFVVTSEKTCNYLLNMLVFTQKTYPFFTKQGLLKTYPFVFSLLHQPKTTLCPCLCVIAWEPRFGTSRPSRLNTKEVETCQYQRGTAHAHMPFGGYR